VTLEGTEIPAVLPDRPTVMLPDGCDIFTVQVVLEPATGFVVRHDTDESAGVAHKLSVAVCDEPPSVAVIVAVRVRVIVPMPALNVAVVAPCGTTRVAGMETSRDEEPSDTVLLLGAAWDRVTVHELVASDMSPLEAHTSELTNTGAERDIGAV
jgi:hypothetical protein